MNSTIRARGRSTIRVAVLVLLASISTTVWADSAIVPPGSTFAGKTYSEWSAAWWQWVAGIPVADNPIFDPTGRNCRVNQSAGAFFLSGSGSIDPVTRKCTVPSDTPIFFPVINAVFAVTLPEETEQIARDFVHSAMDGVQISSLKVTIDETELGGRDLKPFRTDSPPFAISLPGNNIFGERPGQYSPAVSDGFWIMLESLQPGRHVIHFEARIVSGPFRGFAQNVTYVLSVQPR